MMQLKSQFQNTTSICRDTFKLCMKTAIHMINDRQLSADDPRVTALINTAEACYSCLNFSAAGSEAHSRALDDCCAKGAVVMELVAAGNDPLLIQCLEQVEFCMAACRGASFPLASEAG